MLMQAPERSPPLPPSVKAQLILTDGGESGRVIGSRVTHAGVNDSDMSNNQGNAWSASRSTISQRERISGLSRADATARPPYIIHMEDCDGVTEMLVQGSIIINFILSVKKTPKNPLFFHLMWQQEQNQNNYISSLMAERMLTSLVLPVH